MKLRKRSYSEVKNQFITSIIFDKYGSMKNFMKIVPIMLIGAFAFIVGKKYWDHGYISFDLIQIELIGVGFLFVFFLLIFVVQMVVPRRAFLGIHPEGLWIHDEQFGDIGFIEWGWIKKIDLSIQEQIAFVVVYDMDSIKKNIVKKIGFETFAVATNGNEKAIKVPLEHFTKDIYDCINENQFVSIELIELN